MLLAILRPSVARLLATAEAGDDTALLQDAIDQTVVVVVDDAKLQRASARLVVVREAVAPARRERRTSLGLDELKTPDEFVCPITYEVMP